MPALLDPAERAVAAALVARVVSSERRRQLWWWMSLAALTVVGLLQANSTEPDVSAWWTLGIVFVGNMLFHVVLGVVARARLGVDASREVIDVATVLQAVRLVSRGERLDVAAAVDRVDQQQRLRAR